MDRRKIVRAIIVVPVVLLAIAYGLAMLFARWLPLETLLVLTAAAGIIGALGGPIIIWMLVRGVNRRDDLRCQTSPRSESN